MSSVLDGRRHDASILAESGVMNDLEQHAFSPNGTPLCLYGDPAYPLSVHAPPNTISQQPTHKPDEGIQQSHEFSSCQC